MAVKATKESWNAYMREYRIRNPDIVRNNELNKKYGISLDDYAQLALKQNCVCAICKQPETKVDWRSKRPLPLAVDHCHETGKVRGLLCADCNRALGMFGDNPEVLLNAIKYFAGI